MLTISKLLLKYSKNQTIGNIFSVLRPAIVGFIAAAAILLMSADNFGSPSNHTFQFAVSILLFLFSFIGTRLFKVHPILMILLAGLAGLIIY
jgi:chromate transporter